MKQIEIFVFSFNRGKFLKNCVESAVKYIPNAKITVVDDNSTDKETLKILNQLAQNVTVLKPKLSYDERWGSFYSNINWVIQELAINDWAILIEDDMQFIRPFLDEDKKRIKSFFQSFPKSGYLTLEFLKEEHREKDKHTIEIDRSNNMYFFNEDALAYRGTIHLCSSGILNIKLMRKKGYKFVGTRPEVRERARKLFTKKGFYPYPLLMYLPFAPATKNKNKTITRCLVEKWYRTGFYPYQEMTKKVLNNLLTRDISVLPYTSDWLKTAVNTPMKPYEYKDSMKRVNKWVRKLVKLEKLLTRK